MGKRENLTGQKFNRLLVLREIKCEDGAYRFVCKCDCGKEVLRLGKNLRSKNSIKSCGCYTIEQLKKRSTTHGFSSSKEYSSWHSLKNRCLNPKSKDYIKYGGRGITVYETWIDSFEAFLSDVGHATSDAHTLDRIDVNGNYEPGNCRWATQKEQGNNRRTNKFIEYEGIIKTAAQWADDFNIGRKTLLYRLKHNWSIENTFNIPVNHGNSNFNYNHRIK